MKNFLCYACNPIREFYANVARYNIKLNKAER